jgi:hypothetical protein
MNVDSPNAAKSTASIIGVGVEWPCRSGTYGHITCTIGQAKEPHAAAYHCATCGQWSGWVPKLIFEFIAELVRVSGRPTEPIRVSPMGHSETDDSAHKPKDSTMRKSEIFQTKYLKAADLGGKPTTLTIATAPLETLKAPDGKVQKRIVLSFKETTQRLVLNTTNFDAVVGATGLEDTDDWVGCQIVAYPTTTTLGGKTVDCIRIRRAA